MTSQELLGKFEALKEIKAQYLVGSQEAHRYLKSVRYYESVCDAVKKASGWDLTVKQVVKATEALFTASKLFVDFISIKKSKPDDFSLAADLLHGFVKPTMIELERKVSDYFLKSGDFVWTIDPIPVFVVICNAYEKNEFDFSTLSAKSLFNFLLTIGRRIKFLIFLKTGEKLSGIDIARNARFRSSNGYTLEGAVTLAIDPSLQDENDPNLMLKRRLKKVWDQNNLILCHRILKKIKLKNFLEENILMHSRDEGSLSTEEYSFLHNIDNLYERAVREYTLRTIAVERQISLGLVYEFADYLSENGAVPVVDMAIKWQLKLRDGSKKRLAELTKYNAPSSIIGDEKKLHERRCYYYLALRKNRPWLIEYFSR